MICIVNKSLIALTKNYVFHGGRKHIHKRYQLIIECVDNDQVEIEQIVDNFQKADFLTKALERVRFKEMREFVIVQDLKHDDFKFRGENVESKLEDSLIPKLT